MYDKVLGLETKISNWLFKNKEISYFLSTFTIPTLGGKTFLKKKKKKKKTFLTFVNCVRKKFNPKDNNT